jgi:hypothetical protein
MALGIAAVLALMATLRLRWPAPLEACCSGRLGRLRAGRLRDRQFQLGTAGRKLLSIGIADALRSGFNREMLLIFTMYNPVYRLYSCSIAAQSIGLGATLMLARPVGSRFGGDDGRGATQPVRNIDGSRAVGAVGREV